MSALPFCRADGTVGCGVGVPCCVANPTTANACTQTLNSCSRPGGTVGTGGWFGNEGAVRPPANSICRHLFPVAPGYVAGDGAYGAGEEQFWRTDPADPDTAENGNKDEANITGLGRDTFTWNYVAGDKVGVVIEGTSMLPTKYSDSSNAIMWAFSKNKCPIDGRSTGSIRSSASRPFSASSTRKPESEKKFAYTSRVSASSSTRRIRV